MPWPKEEPTDANPPDRAMINDHLKSTARKPVTLEIRRADGRLVRRYSSDDAVTPIPDAKSAPVPLYWYGPPQSPSPAAVANMLAAVTAALSSADAVMARWASLKSADLPALNATLKAAGLTTIGGAPVR